MAVGVHTVHKGEVHIGVEEQSEERGALYGVQQVLQTEEER